VIPCLHNRCGLLEASHPDRMDWPRGVVDPE
jgi:hypothetical protein